MTSVASQWRARGGVALQGVVRAGCDARTTGDADALIQCQPAIPRLGQCLRWTSIYAGGVHAEMTSDWDVASGNIVLDHVHPGERRIEAMAMRLAARDLTGTAARALVLISHKAKVHAGKSTLCIASYEGKLA